MDILVDSDVLLDIMTDDNEWCRWSAKTLAYCADNGTLVINPLIYAEASMGFKRIEELEDAIPSDCYRREQLPWEAAFLAGKCFLQYRKKGGERRAPLPDFYIGAHAAVTGMALLTRDPSRYRAYFPTLRIICPDEGKG